MSMSDESDDEDGEEKVAKAETEDLLEAQVSQLSEDTDAPDGLYQAAEFDDDE